MRSGWAFSVQLGALLTLPALLGTGNGWATWRCLRPFAGDFAPLLALAGALLGFGLGSALLVRVLLAFRPLPEGRHPPGSVALARWQTCALLYQLGTGALRPLTPIFLRAWVLRLFGARIGRGVAVGGAVGDPWTLEVGDNAVLGHNSVVVGHLLSGGELLLAPVRIGRAATVGVNAVITPGCHVGEGAVVAAGSVLRPGTRVAPGERWGGVPARRLQPQPPPESGAPPG